MTRVPNLSGIGLDRDASTRKARCHRSPMCHGPKWHS